MSNSYKLKHPLVVTTLVLVTLTIVLLSLTFTSTTPDIDYTQFNKSGSSTSQLNDSSVTMWYDLEVVDDNNAFMLLWHNLSVTLEVDMIKEYYDKIVFDFQKMIPPQGLRLDVGNTFNGDVFGFKVVPTLGYTFDQYYQERWENATATNTTNIDQQNFEQRVKEEFYSIYENQQELVSLQYSLSYDEYLDINKDTQIIVGIVFMVLGIGIQSLTYSLVDVRETRLSGKDQDLEQNVSEGGPNTKASMLWVVFAAILLIAIIASGDFIFFFLSFVVLFLVLLTIPTYGVSKLTKSNSLNYHMIPFVGATAVLNFYNGLFYETLFGSDFYLGRRIPELSAAIIGIPGFRFTLGIAIVLSTISFTWMIPNRMDSRIESRSRLILTGILYVLNIVIFSYPHLRDFFDSLM